MPPQTGTKDTPHGTLYAIAAILAVAAVLRIFYIRAQDFYIDEAFNFLMARQDLMGILSGSAAESNPPLPAAIAHLWISISGHGVVAIRLMSLCFSLAAVWFTYLIGRRLAGERGALVAAALAAISPFQLFYSHVFRYPALSILIGALATYLYLEIAFGKRRALAAPFALVCVAALYTHYYFVFLLFSFNVHYVFVIRREGVLSLPAWIASQSAVAISFVPWVSMFSSQGAKELAPIPLAQVIAHAKSFPFKGILNVLQSFITGFYPIEHNAAVLAAGIIAILAAATSFILAKSAHRERVFSACMFILCFFPPYLMMLFLGLRILPEMYFCFFSPLFYAIIAQSLTLNAPPLARCATAALFLGLLAVALPYYAANISSPNNNENMIKYIVTHSRPGDIVVVNPTYQASMFMYFAPGRLSLFGIPREFDILNYNYNDFTQVSPLHLAALDAAAEKSGGRIWCFNGFGDVTKPDAKALTTRHLKKNHRLVMEKSFRPISFSDEIGRLYLFE